ncbi:MAG TPA: polysaccharide biosynthesis/export family protein [Stellaceae bacterium]|nr:polysaccharide biosynthesis/export family protein [Stellaceae bacterium]
MFSPIIIAGVSALALLLAGCSNLPQRDDVIAQANQQGEIAFNVVKIDEAVVNVVAARPRPAFRERFKEYLPAPELKIAIGDTVSVVIWEAAANGLFGKSLNESPLGRRRVTGLETRLTPAGEEAARSDRIGSLTESAAASGLVVASSPALPSVIGGAALGVLERGAAGVNERARHAWQTGRPGTEIPEQPVGPDGTITIPYAGRVIAADRTASELGSRIEALLGPIAIDPQALVIVQHGAGSAVTVAGEGVQGARVPLSPGGTRLLDVIAAAGGASTPVHETFVRLSRDGVTATVPLAVLVADPDQNIFARPGDVLILSRAPQTLSVFGAAGMNASITFATERLSLAEALAKAGGLLDQRSDASAIFVMRHESAELVHALGQPVAARAPAGLSPIVYRLDLADAKSYLLAKRFPVQDRDIIFVAEAKLVPVTRALQALSRITGPVLSGMLICRRTNC